MKLGDRIQLRLKEAGVYQEHGLFPEAMRCYEEALTLLEPTADSPGKQKLKNYIAGRTRILESEEARVSDLERSSHLSDRQQQVVQGTLSASEEKKGGEAGFQVAATLMGFGQFNDALARFNALLQKPSLQISAAKNILRCQIAVGSTELAVRQYHQWLETEGFTEEGLEHIRSFLEGVLRQKGSNEQLVRPYARSGSTDALPGEEELFDVMAVVLPGIADDPGGEPRAFDVTSQSGPFVSLIVPSEDKAVVVRLKPGVRIQGANFFTPEALFADDCVVSSRLRIDEGRRKGDFSVTLRLLKT